MSDPYSERMHDAAERWGICIPGRPPIIRLPGSVPKEYKIPTAKEYTHVHDSAKSSIELFTVNDLWGYWLRITLRKQGFSSPPYVFSDQYPSESEAFDAAWNEALKFAQKAVEDDDPHAGKFLDWLGYIHQLQQPTLF